MSLTASMWTGVSGLRGHGQKMGVIGNNIANVSTLGFKGSRLHFADFMSQNVSTTSGPAQVGRGVAVGAVLGDFSQGSLENTNESLDVAITGNGFFMVSPPAQTINYYTRAGNFRLDYDRYLVDPHGHRVQGWQMQNGQIIGAPGDIHLNQFQSPPAATQNTGFISNLDSRSQKYDSAAVGNIWADWNSADIPPMGQANYTHQSTMRVYDENGNGHDMTVYYRQREPLGGEDPAQKYWQFIVTCDPDEDLRDGAANPDRGLLFHGEMIFDGTGNLIEYNDLHAYNDPNAPGPPAARPLVHPDDFRNGYPLFYADFLGTSAVPAQEYQAIELNFGMTFDGTNFTPEDPATTSYASPNSTLFLTQDGYASGYLQNVHFNSNGVMFGRYSNGQVEEMFTLSIADFNSVWGLRREGGNLFAETQESGPVITGVAGTGRLGTVAGNSLELSNVDLATEFVKMITTQKGFQANSKTITTVDMMLDEVIRMKR